MPMPADTDTTSPKYLRDKYAIVGVGETEYMRGSGVTTRALARTSSRKPGLRSQRAFDYGPRAYAKIQKALETLVRSRCAGVR